MRSWLVGRAGFTRLLVIELVLSLALGLGVALFSGLRAGFSWSAGGMVEVIANAVLGFIFLSGTPGQSHVARWIFGEILKWLVVGVLVAGAIWTGFVSGIALAGGFFLLLLAHVAGISLLLVRVDSLVA